MRISTRLSVVRVSCCSLALCLGLGLGPGQVNAATGSQPSPREREFIEILRSNAPQADKAIACKRLAIVGSAAAVPALSPLLEDKELASWVRIALEAIPGPEADAALREAMDRVQGVLLVGVVNSIGNRRDRGAVKGLAALLTQNDPDVVGAAGFALGRIGGPEAAAALERALTRVSPVARSEVAEGCILCAEGFLVQGERSQALKLYELVRQSSVFKPRVVEATRGAILARGDAGLPILIQQLQSSDEAFLSVGLSTARELPGRKITGALLEEVRRAEPERQGLILMAVGDRRDPLVLPAIREIAQDGPAELRMVAVNILEHRGGLESLPVLLEAAVDQNKALSDVARLSLARFGGSEVDTELVDRLKSSEDRSREVLIELCGRRGIESSVPVVVGCLDDGDPGVFRASITTLGLLGTAEQLPALVACLPKASRGRDRAELEKALVSIAGREGRSSVRSLLPVLEREDTDARKVALHALAAAGGPDALRAVVQTAEHGEGEVRDEAVRTLVSWANTWPGDAGVAAPLLALAKDGAKTSYRVQGLRGYLQYLREDRVLKPAEKMATVEEVLSMVQRPEEKRLVIAVLGTIPTVQSLQLLMGYAADSAITEEACLAIVNISAGPRLGNEASDTRRQALRMVLDHSKSDRTRRKARELL